MKRSFKNITLFSNLPIAILLSVGCLFLWLPDFMKAATSEQITYQFLYLPLSFFTIIQPLWIVSIALLLSLLNAWLLTYLLYHFGINRRRAYLPIFLYLLTVGSVRALHTNIGIQIVIFLFFIVQLILYGMYKSRTEVEKSFLATLFLTLGSCVMPDMLFFIPFLWLAFVISATFSPRVWLASVVGLLTYGLFISTFAIFSERGIEVSNMFATLFDRSLFHEFYSSWSFPVLFGCLTLFFAVFLGAFYLYNRDNVRVQVSLNNTLPFFFVCLLGVLFPATIFPNMYGIALMIIIFFAVHYFLSVQSNFRSIIFLMYIAVLLIYWAYSVFNFPFL